MFQDLGAFVLVAIVVICTPGPDTALIIRNTLAGGRRAGLGTALGIVCGIAIWTLAASVGLAALLSASEPVFRVLRLAGAGYLVYLGLQSIVWALSGRAHAARRLGTATRLMPRRGYRQGLLSNLGNPKIAVFFVSLLPQFVPAGGGSFLALAALGLVFSLMGLVWLSLYVVGVARAEALLGGRVRQAIDTVTGAVLIALGIRLATDER
jgi:threonine/homoserine/homoserine lactone efflux protein